MGVGWCFRVSKGTLGFFALCIISLEFMAGYHTATAFGIRIWVWV